MPMESATMAAGITARFTFQVGGKLRMLDFRVRVARRFLLPQPRQVAVPKHFQQYVPPLHDNQCEEVHRLRLVQ